MVVILRDNFKERTVDRPYDEFSRALGKKREVADCLQHLWRVNPLRNADDGRIDSLFNFIEGRNQLIPGHHKGVFTSAARLDRITESLCLLSGAIQIH